MHTSQLNASSKLHKCQQTVPFTITANRRNMSPNGCSLNWQKHFAQILSHGVHFCALMVCISLYVIYCLRPRMCNSFHQYSWRNCPHCIASQCYSNSVCDVTIWHDDVIKWKHFPRYWPFVRGIHRSPVNSPHKGQWRRALMFTLICARINGWVNNGEAVDLRRNRAHYDVIVMAHTGGLLYLMISLMIQTS